MDTLNEGLLKLFDLLVWSYMATFILLAYIVKGPINNFFVNYLHRKWEMVYTVLILAFLVAIPWVLFTNNLWENIALSYAVGTSFHELIFSKIEKLIRKDNKSNE